MTIVARTLSFAYDKDPVLRGVDLDVTPGEVVALVGPSGSGKSTLLYCLAGVLRGWTGQVSVDGQSLETMTDRQLSDFRATTCGYVLQFGRLISDLSAVENVALPLRMQGVKRRNAERAALQVMAAVGVDDLARHSSRRLSGGEQQRTAVARALVHEPSVVFADEPTGALDRRNGELVMDALVSQARVRGATIVLVTHEEAVALRADRVVMIEDGVLDGSIAVAGV